MSNSKYSKYQSSSSAKTAVFLCIIGLVLVMLPFFLQIDLGTTAILAVTILGGTLTILGVILILLTKLYIKAPANEALVITGMRKKTIIDGGGFFIPMFMDLMPVPLDTMKLVVEQKGGDAFITDDNLRVDICSEFYIKVPKNPQRIQIAATTLGEKGVNSNSILELVREKLISAMRDGVAKKTLQQLHAERSAFASEVNEAVKEPLEQNGLSLESVTISNLDQTDYSSLDLNNIFNAQGAKTIAQVTEVAKKEKVEIELANELATQKMRVETRKQLDNQKIEEEKSAALREQAISIAQSEADKVSREKAAEFNRTAQTAEIEQTKAVEVAEIKKEEAKELARIHKEELIAIRDEQKKQAAETAEIERQVKVAEKLEEEAAAEAKANKAKAEAQKEAEAVITVKVQAEADRDKITRVIAKEAAAEEAKIMQQNEADIKAYETEKLAEADKKAALDRAHAIKEQAQAEKEAAIMMAEGKKAQEMIPVEVQKEEVKVEAERVKVVKDELEAKAKYESVSVKLTTNLAEIDANKEIQTAFAKAMGEAISSADIQIFGDNSTMKEVFNSFIEGRKKAEFLNSFEQNLAITSGESGEESIAKEMLKKYLTGQENAMMAEGFVANTPPAVKEMLDKYIGTAGGTLAGLAALASSVLGSKASDEQVEKLQKLVSTDDEEDISDKE